MKNMQIDKVENWQLSKEILKKKVLKWVMIDLAWAAGHLNLVKYGENDRQR